MICDQRDHLRIRHAPRDEQLYDQWRYCFPAYETFEERKKRKLIVDERRRKRSDNE